MSYIYYGRPEQDPDRDNPLAHSVNQGISKMLRINSLLEIIQKALVYDSTRNQQQGTNEEYLDVLALVAELNWQNHDLMENVLFEVRSLVASLKPPVQDDLPQAFDPEQDLTVQEVIDRWKQGNNS